MSAAGDGTLTLSSGDRRVSGLGGIEDVGDRGDTYDFDPVDDDPGAVLRTVTVERRRHVSGIQRLVVTRTFDVPASVAPQRDRRVSDTVVLTVRVEARVAPSVDRIDLHVETDNPARDHRMRLLFPTGAPVESFLAATTFDVATRTNVPPPATGWWHAPPDAFPHQGWVSANGLTVGAPGLPEAEVTEEGVIAVTLLRAVGWLSHLELRRRPIPAGPTLVAPDAQCPDGIKADLTIRLDPDGLHDPGATAARAVADELGLRAVPAGTDPLLPVGTELVHRRTGVGCPFRAEARRGRRRDDPSTPQSHRRRSRCHGPSRSAHSKRFRFVSTRPLTDRSFERRGPRLSITVGPHALRTLRLRPEG